MLYGQCVREYKKPSLFRLLLSGAEGRDCFLVGSVVFRQDVVSCSVCMNIAPHLLTSEPQKAMTVGERDPEPEGLR